jgi:hypothetical protein
MHDAHVLKPHGHLLRQGLVACVVFLIPVFVVLYFVTVPTGAWPVVVAGQLVATLIVLATAITFLRTAIWVNADGISERGFFGRMKRLSRANIGSIMIVETFDGGSDETIPQLFVRNHEGELEIRMRGQYWSRENMELVMETLGVPTEQLPDRLTAAELRDDFPGLLYWFERHPILAAALFTISAAIIVTLLVLLFQGGAAPLA